MLTEERHQFILAELKQHQIVKSQDLIQQTQASESTIRRDLQILEQGGYLVRVHGGAKQVTTLQTELAVNEKSSQSVQEKNAIAKTAVKLLAPRDVIFLDAGTTTLAMIPYLEPDLKLTVVTNGVSHASLLADRNIHCYLLGGFLKNSTKAVIGPESIALLNQYRFNKAFMGTNGVHLKYGFTTPDPEEAAVKRAALQQADQVIFMADHTKFEQVSFAKIADLSAGMILTDRLAQADRLNYQQQTDIQEAFQ